VEKENGENGEKGNEEKEKGENAANTQSLIYSARLLLEQITIYITDKNSQKIIEKIKKTLSEIDNSPISEEDKNRIAVLEINVPTATPKRTLSGLMEEKKKYFDEMDKFQLVEVTGNNKVMTRYEKFL